MVPHRSNPCNSAHHTPRTPPLAPKAPRPSGGPLKRALVDRDMAPDEEKSLWVALGLTRLAMGESDAVAAVTAMIRKRGLKHA
jgi:hypothetical protein